MTEDMNRRVQEAEEREKRAVAKAQRELEEQKKWIEQQRREEVEKSKEAEICRQREHDQRKQKIDREMEQLKVHVEQLERQCIAQVRLPNSGTGKDPNRGQSVKRSEEGFQPRSISNRQQETGRSEQTQCMVMDQSAV